MHKNSKQNYGKPTLVILLKLDQEKALKPSMSSLFDLKGRS